MSAVKEFRLRSGDARKDGLFVLDGGVLEAFGFGVSESRRVQLSLMQSAELVEKGETYLKLEGASKGVQQLAQVVEADDPELANLVDAVKAAAHDMED